MTDYIYAANVICPVTHLALGNALADAVDPDVGGGLTFTNGLPCYPAGTTITRNGITHTASNPVSARAAFPLLKATGYSMIQEFLSAGPYSQLNALGFSDAQIAAGKAALTIDVGSRDAIYGTGIAFCQSQGYVVP